MNKIWDKLSKLQRKVRSTFNELGFSENNRLCKLLSGKTKAGCYSFSIFSLITCCDVHYASAKSGHFTLLLARTTLYLSRLNVYLFIFQETQIRLPLQSYQVSKLRLYKDAKPARHGNSQDNAMFLEKSEL